MLDVLLALVRSLLTALRGNRNLALDSLTLLRHQLMVSQRQCPVQHGATLKETSTTGYRLEKAA